MKSTIIGLLIAGAVAGVTCMVAKATEKKYVETKVDKEGVEVDSTEVIEAGASTKVKKILTKAMKKAVLFAVEHMDEIQAVGALLGTLGTAVTLLMGVRDLRLSEKRDKALFEIHDMLADIYNTEPLYHPVENPTTVNMIKAIGEAGYKAV